MDIGLLAVMPGGAIVHPNPEEQVPDIKLELITDILTEEIETTDIVN